MTVRTVAALLAEAVTTGRRIAAIKGEWKLWTLSREAWTRRCLELGGWQDLAQLEAARDRLALFPNLWNAAEIRARLWADRGQDQPALYGFAMGDRDPVVHAELLASSLSVAEVSAIASYMVTEMRPEGAWGSADSLDDGPAAVEPHEAALVELDRLLSRTILFEQATWSSGLWTIAHGGVEVVMDGVTAHCLASTFAAAAALRRDREPAAAVAA